MAILRVLNRNRFREKLVSWRGFAFLCVLLALAQGCSVGPKYTKPVAEIPPAYKGAGNWKVAEPSDEARKGNWWGVFHDAQLNTLEEKLTVSNQSLRAAQDRFLEARAALRGSRSYLYPTVSVGPTITRERQSLNRALATSSSIQNYSDFLVTGGDVLPRS